MKKFFLFFVAALFCANVNADKAVTINSNASATQGHFPVYGDNADNKGQKVQAIYLADQLKNIEEGSEIKALTFYSSKATQSWGSAQFKVSLAQTTYAFFQNASGAWATSSTGTFTQVYNGPLSVADGELTINFTTPYAYEGGNLLIQVEITTAGTYASSSFYSASDTDYLIKYASGGTSREAKQPKITLIIADGGDDPVSQDCKAPTALTVESVTDVAATISWEGEASQYQYCLEFEGNQPDWTEANLTNLKSVELSGLYGDEKFYFYLRSYCSETEVSETVKVTFRTACPAMSLPYLETFSRDVTGDVAPECWIIASENPKVWVVADKTYDGEGNTSVVSGQAHLGVSGGGPNTEQVFSLPMLDAKLDTCEVAFDYWTSMTTDDCGQLEVGYMTNPSKPATFVSLQTYPRTLDKTHVVLPLDELPEDVHYISFRFAGGTSDIRSLSMDNFVVAGIGHSDEIDPEDEQLPDANIYEINYCGASFTWYEYTGGPFAIGLFSADLEKLISGIVVTSSECDRFAEQDGVGFSEDDDYENKYYCSSKWMLNAEDGGYRKGEAWDACVYSVSSATGAQNGLKPGKYQVQIYLYDEEAGGFGSHIATINFEITAKQVMNLQAVVADDHATATLTWETPELAYGERLYMSVRSGELVPFDNFEDTHTVAESPLTVEVVEGRTYTATLQVVNRHNDPQGPEVSVDFTVGSNLYEPQNPTATVFGGDNVTFDWEVEELADFYEIVLYLNGEYYTTTNVVGKTTKTLTMPADGTWSWTVQPFTKGSNDNYYPASGAVPGNDFETKAADIPEDAIELNVWGMEAAYLDEYVSKFPQGKHGWMVMFATGEEGSTGYPMPWFLIYTDKDDAISGTYNAALGNIDLESTYVNTNGTQAGCIMATDAEVKLHFDGYDDEKAQSGYRYAFYSGQFRITTTDGKTYVGRYMEQFCNSFNFSTYSTIRDHVGMWGEDPDYDPMGIEDIVVTETEGAQKLLHDGQLFIIREGRIFNAQGTLVK